jgi:hypothetical protein
MTQKRISRRRLAAHSDSEIDTLYDYARSPRRRVRRAAKEEENTWTVTDDWPEQVPVTAAEVDVFEAWFGDLFDQLFGPRR